MHFTAKGHKNVLSTHRNTFEFTHENELSLRGDCILGISADYTLEAIQKKQFSGKIRICVSVDGISEEIIAEYNPIFADSHEMVIRKTDFADKRTFAIRSNKAAKDMNRELVNKLKNHDAVATIVIEEIS